MKKLISLLAALSVVTAFSVGATATEFTVEGSQTGLTATDAAQQVKYEKGNDGLYDVDLTTVAGQQAQTTILAVKGTTISVGSIQYIGQSATPTFSFDLKDNLTEKVNVLAGGSSISPTLVGYMEPAQETNTFTVSGTVTDSTGASDSIALLEDPEVGMDQETIDSFKNSWGIKVSLVAYDSSCTNLINYLLEYIGEEAEAVVPIATTTADINTGVYSFENVEPGKYVLIFERAGALPLFSYVDVVDANVSNVNKTLICGNLVADTAISDTDLDPIFAAFGVSYFDDDNTAYNAQYDIAADFSLNDVDLGTIFTNFGADMTYYNENAINDVFAALE